MSAGTSELFCLIVCFLVCSSEAQTNITAELGQNVTLPCKVPNNITIIRAVEWSRPDQDPDYVLLYRDGHLDVDNQHPSYQNRVDLQEKEMKDGDFSLVLKNVTMEDNGRYECYVVQRGTNRRKRSSSEPIRIINLEVHPSGDNIGIRDKGSKIGGDQVGISRGHPGVVGVIVLLLAVALVAFLIYRQHMKKKPNLPVPPDDPTEPATASETLMEPPAEEQTTASETLMEPAAAEQRESRCGPTMWSLL